MKALSQQVFRTFLRQKQLNTPLLSTQRFFFVNSESATINDKNISHLNNFEEEQANKNIKQTSFLKSSSQTHGTFLKHDKSKTKQNQPKYLDHQLQIIMQQKLLNELKEIESKPDDYQIKMNIETIKEVVKRLKIDGWQIRDQILLNLDRFQLNRFERTDLLDYIVEMKQVHDLDTYKLIVDHYKKYEYRSKAVASYLERCHKYLNNQENKNTMTNDQIRQYKQMINEDMLDIVNTSSLYSLNAQERVIEQINQYKNQQDIVQTLQYIHKYMQMVENDGKMSTQFDGRLQTKILSFIDFAITKLDNDSLEQQKHKLYDISQFNSKNYNKQISQQMKNLIKPLVPELMKKKNTANYKRQTLESDQEYIQNIIQNQYSSRLINVDELNTLLQRNVYSDYEIGKLLDFSVNTAPLDTLAMRDQIDLTSSSLKTLTSYILHTLINDQSFFDQEIIEKVIEKSKDISQRQTALINRLQMIQFVLELAEQSELADKFQQLPAIQFHDRKEYDPEKIIESMYSNVDQYHRIVNLELYMHELAGIINQNLNNHNLVVLRSSRLYQQIKMFINLERTGLLHKIDNHQTVSYYFYHLSEQYHDFTVIKDGQEYLNQIPNIVKFCYQILNYQIPDHRLLFVKNQRKFYKLNDEQQLEAFKLFNELNK